MGRTLIVEADGGSRGNPGPAGYGALVRDAATGAVLAERARYLGVVSNNVAEYSGLVAGLDAARSIDPEARVVVRMDSKLVVEQMSGRWKIKHEDMRRLAAEAAQVLPPSQVTYEWVPRADNSAADALANQVMDSRGEIAHDHWVADATPVTDQGQADTDPAVEADRPERCARRRRRWSWFRHTHAPLGRPGPVRRCRAVDRRPGPARPDAAHGRWCLLGLVGSRPVAHGAGSGAGRPGG